MAEKPTTYEIKKDPSVNSGGSLTEKPTKAYTDTQKSDSTAGEANQKEESKTGVNQGPGGENSQPGLIVGGVQEEKVVQEVKIEQERTMAKKKLFLEFFEKTLGSVKATCDKIGISRETFYDWRRNDPEFIEKVRALWARKLEDVEQQLNKGITEANMRAVTYFLDRRHPLYRPRVKIEGPKPGEPSLEDEFDSLEWMDDNENYGKTKDKQPDGDTAKAENPKQEGGGSAIHTERGPEILLGAQDKKEPDTQSPAEGNK